MACERVFAGLNGVRMATLAYNPLHKWLESVKPNSDHLAFVVQLPDCPSFGLNADTGLPTQRGDLVQLPVFYFGLLQDGDFAIGVFPESKKVPIGGLCFRHVPRQCIGPA